MRETLRLLTFFSLVTAVQAGAQTLSPPGSPAVPPPTPNNAPPDTKDIGTVNATGFRINLVPGTPFPSPAPDTPAYVAPSRTPLEASQPTSVVGHNFIEESTTPAQNYDELVKFTPSLMNIQPAGPVSQQNYGESIRGFQYNQINTTFDGIVLPGGPSNFAPQSATYFTSHDLGSVDVERGPGTASQIGYATFGGTIGLLSKSPTNTVSINPYSAVGSYKQQLFGIEGDTGIISQAGGGRGMLDVSRLTTNAYLTGVTTDRTNGFAKWEQPISDNTVLTFVGMVNGSYGHTAYGSTIAQLNAYGRNYGLNNDPTSQAFSGYNTDVYDTDFEYIRARSNLGDGFGIDETVYTVSYFRNGTEGKDPNGTTSNLTGTYFINNLPVSLTNAVPGVDKHNDFRDWGTITRGTYDTPYGQARVGLWFDYVANGVYRTNIILSDLYQVYTTKAGANQFSQYYHDQLTTVQPYAEFAIKPLPDLTITPGVKFTSVERDLDAVVLSNTPLGKSSRSWSDVLPAIDAHYMVRPDLAVYAQVAQGFLAPPLSTLQTTVPGTVTPETTTNYQIGTAWQTKNVTLGADAYYIPFNNYITSQTNSTGTLYSNSGDALYKGIELEGTVRINYALSLYANATLNSATFNDGQPIYQAPQHTAAAGPIVNITGALLPEDKFYASILWKEVGKQFGQNSNNSAGQPIAAYPIKTYGDFDFAVHYTLPIQTQHKVNLGLNVFNVLDNKSIVGFAGTTSGSPSLPLYWTNPGRSFFVTLSVTL